mmetsp:Transcript_6593/g.10007  ORF Transcript_6593/g.10007 Transcript_6593/m.10007 type:complete len:96 (-) Transcript_6593:31-318(-)
MSSGKEDNNNTDNNTKSEPTNLDQSVDEIHEIHDIDDIPTLDDLVDIDHLQEIENQKWEELPPLKELVRNIAWHGCWNIFSTFFRYPREHWYYIN